MATGSLDGVLRQTLNATSANYRALKRGLPVLVGDSENVVRVRWGGQPHRKASGIGNEFIATADPPEQPNPLAGGVRLFETVWMAKQPDPGKSIRVVSRYMFLQRDQDWRIYSSHAHVRGQCDRPTPGITPVSPLFAPMVPPGNGTLMSVSATAWAERDLSWASYLTRSIRKVAAYGKPIGVGIAAGMVRNHRAALAAPVFFSSVFVIWTRYSGSPDPFASFATQARENAKDLRSAISYGFLEIARWRRPRKILTVLGVLGVAYRETYLWVTGGEIRTTVDSPGPTEAPS